MKIKVHRYEANKKNPVPTTFFQFGSLSVRMTDEEARRVAAEWSQWGDTLNGERECVND